MESKIEKKLKSLSKDSQSFNDLKELFEELSEEADRFKKHLRLLERAIENDYDSILITDLQLDEPGPSIVYVNDGFTDMTGYTRDEVIGKTPRILQGPKTDRAVLDRLKERLKNGKPFFGQAVNYKKDGSEFINQWDIHPLTDEDGRLTHWVSYQHDITKRKRAEQTVMDVHAEFDDLRESSKSTLLDVDTQGTIVSANKSFRNLTGYAKDELKGKKVWELFPRKYRNSLKTRFDKHFDSADFENQNLKGIIKHKKGLPIQVEGVSNVLKLKDRTLIRTEIKNISLQKRIMETLKKRNVEYDKIVDKATEFNYRISLQNGAPVLEYVSDDFTKITGISPQQITGAGEWEKIIHDDDVEKVRECLQKVTEGSSCTCEYRLRTKDGSYQKVIDYCKPVESEGGSSNTVRGAISIVSEQEPA